MRAQLRRVLAPTAVASKEFAGFQMFLARARAARRKGVRCVETLAFFHFNCSPYDDSVGQKRKKVFKKFEQRPEKSKLLEVFRRQDDVGCVRHT